VAPVLAIETQDLDEARQCIRDVFTPHRLVFRGRAEVDLHLRYAESPRLTVGHLQYGADVKVDVPPPESCYHLALPVRGAANIGQGDELVGIEAGAWAAMLSADRPLSVHWSPDAVQYIVKISRESLESQLARLTGRPVGRPIQFGLRFALNTPGAQALLSSVDFLWRELDRPGGIGAVPMAREHLERAVLTQLLTVVPHDHSYLLGGGAAPGDADLAGRIPRLIEYIDAHADEDLSTGQLAQLAGITERALQLGFRKAVGTTPVAYVRAVRLDRVHDELSAGLRPGATITDVAMRWGFFHPSRFAQQYRERFGVLPSQTVDTL
jgi:AraC-like DNA-binding protein